MSRREVDRGPAAHELDPHVRAVSLGREVRHELPVGRDRGARLAARPGREGQHHRLGSLGRRPEPVAGGEPGEASETEAERESQPRRAGRPADTAVATSAADVEPNERRAKARSLADWNRCSGSLARQRWTTRVSPRGASARIEAASGGSSLKTAAMWSWAVFPPKGRRPVRAS